MKGNRTIFHQILEAKNLIIEPGTYEAVVADMTARMLGFEPAGQVDFQQQTKRDKHEH